MSCVFKDIDARSRSDPQGTAWNRGSCRPLSFVTLSRRIWSVWALSKDGAWPLVQSCSIALEHAEAMREPVSLAAEFESVQQPTDTGWRPMETRLPSRCQDLPMIQCVGEAP
jgi:hypothetical protein